MPNIMLSYMYRDGANYKNHNDIVFANPLSKELTEIEQSIKSELIDREWFYANKWNVPDLHFEKWDEEIDHSYHEFESISYTTDLPTDNRTIDQFISEIKS